MQISFPSFKEFLFLSNPHPIAPSYLDPHNCALFPCLSNPHNQSFRPTWTHTTALWLLFLKQKWRGFPSNLKCGEGHSSYLGVASPWKPSQTLLRAPDATNSQTKPLHFLLRLSLPPSCRLLLPVSPVHFLLSSASAPHHRLFPFSGAC
jgi:hypothetical protein